MTIKAVAADDSASPAVLSDVATAEFTIRSNSGGGGGSSSKKDTTTKTDTTETDTTDETETTETETEPTETTETEESTTGDTENTNTPENTTKPTVQIENLGDVSQSQWYYKAVDFVVSNGLMSGVSASEFAPNELLSRAMLAQVLFNQAGKPETDAEVTYTDAEQDAWYATALAWATEANLLSGYGDGTFGPNDPITREQLALILYRFEGAPEVETEEIDFSDAEQVSDYAKKAVAWAIQEGIINGKGEGTLDPKGQATRAEIAQVLFNYFA